MKKQRDDRAYFAPLILFLTVHFVFFLISAFSVYLYAFQQFLYFCKYFAYIYALIMATDYCRRRYETKHAAAAAADGTTDTAAADRNKKNGLLGRLRKRKPKKAPPAEADAADAAPAADQARRVIHRVRPQHHVTEEKFRLVLTSCHVALLLFLLYRFSTMQFSAFIEGSLVDSGGYGIFCIGVCIVAAAAFFAVGGWFRNLPAKPGSVTAYVMILCIGIVFSVSALFLTLEYVLHISCLTILVFILRAISLLFVLIVLVGTVLSLIKKNLLSTFDYVSFLTVTRGEKKQTFADLLETHTGLSVKSLWSIRYALGLLPTALLALAVVLFAATSLYKVDPQQQAVVYRLGRIASPAPVKPGLHLKLPWPIDKAEIYDVARVKEVLVGYEQQASADNLWTQAHGGEEYQLLLGDGNELVSVNMKIAYVIDDLHRFVTAYAEPENMLSAKAYELLLHKTITTDLDTFLSVDRSGLSEELAQDLNTFCRDSGIGLHVNSVTLESIHPPISIADVYQSVVSAGVQKNTLITNAEAQREEKIAAAEEEANTLLTKAKQNQTTRVADAQAEIDVFLSAAQAYRRNPGAMTFSKYVDTFETVVSGNRVYVFIGDHDLSDYLVNFSGDAKVVSNSEYVLSSGSAQ